jgi:hypothetical protein
LQVQIEKRNTQASQILDLLHLIGEKPLLPEGELLLETVPVCPPQLATAKPLLRTMDMIMRSGLPPELPQVATDAIFRGIVRLTRGTQPILDWSPPLIVGSQIKLTLEDKQLSLDDPRRRVVVILRAMPTFQGKAAYDCMKVLLEEDHGASSIYFGKCIAFIRDQRLQHFVILHWFTRQEPTTGFDVVSNVPSFKLAPIENTKSYSVLPVDCIMNGAVMMPETPPQLGTELRLDTRYWALMSPREHEEYKLLFQ